MSDAPIVCRSRDGLALEAVVSEPPDPTRSFVLCHPHPQMGGTMNAPLLLALRDRMVSDSWAVLRFNFRGIGASEGVSSDGIPEVADALGAIAAARASWPGLPLAIGGWSFGGAVAVRAAAGADSLLACATVAPAVEAKPGVTAGLPPPAQLELSAPLLVVCGANDKQVDPVACRTWAAEAGADYLEVPGANHFFWAKYEQLADIVAGWLADRVPPRV